MNLVLIVHNCESQPSLQLVQASDEGANKHINALLKRAKEYENQLQTQARELQESTAKLDQEEQEVQMLKQQLMEARSKAEVQWKDLKCQAAAREDRIADRENRLAALEERNR